MLASYCSIQVWRQVLYAVASAIAKHCAYAFLQPGQQALLVRSQYPMSGHKIDASRLAHVPRGLSVLSSRRGGSQPW